MAEMLRDAVHWKERKVVRRSTRECVDRLARIADSVATESTESDVAVRRGFAAPPAEEPPTAEE